MTIYSVYWIHHDNHSDPTSEGYIGVSKSPKDRFKYHGDLKRNDNNRLYHNIQNGAQQTILFEFNSEEEAYKKETELRPNDHIGWNIIAGGDSKPPKHYKNKFNLGNNKPRHSPEHKKYISNIMKIYRWYNNGKHNIRCHPDNVPEGFVLGVIRASRA